VEFIQSCDRCAIIDPDQIHERVTLRINESARPTVDGFSPYLAPLALDLRLTWSAIAVAPGSRSAEQTIDPRDEPRRLAHVFAVGSAKRGDCFPFLTLCQPDVRGHCFISTWTTILGTASLDFESGKIRLDVI